MTSKTTMERNYLLSDVFILNGNDSMENGIDIDALNRKFPNISLENYLLEKMNKEETFFLATIQPGVIPQKDLLTMLNHFDYGLLLVGKGHNDKRSWLTIAFYGILLKKHDKTLEAKLEKMLAWHKVKRFFDYHLNDRVIGKHYL